MNEQMLEQQQEQASSLTLDVSDEALEAAGGSKALGAVPSVIPQSLPLKC